MRPNLLSKPDRYFIEDYCGYLTSEDIASRLGLPLQKVKAAISQFRTKGKYILPEFSVAVMRGKLPVLPCEKLAITSLYASTKPKEMMAYLPGRSQVWIREMASKLGIKCEARYGDRSNTKADAKRRAKETKLDAAIRKGRVKRPDGYKVTTTIRRKPIQKKTLPESTKDHQIVVSGQNTTKEPAQLRVWVQLDSKTRKAVRICDLETVLTQYPNAVKITTPVTHLGSPKPTKKYG